jgi:hypothetical protein
MGKVFLQRGFSGKPSGQESLQASRIEKSGAPMETSAFGTETPMKEKDRIPLSRIDLYDVPRRPPPVKKRGA